MSTTTNAGDGSGGFDIAILILQRPAQPEITPVKLDTGAPVNTLNLPAINVSEGSGLLLLGYGLPVSHNLLYKAVSKLFPKGI